MTEKIGRCLLVQVKLSFGLRKVPVGQLSTHLP